MMRYVLYNTYRVSNDIGNYVYKSVFVEFIGRHQLRQIETFNLEIIPILLPNKRERTAFHIWNTKNNYTC